MSTAANVLIIILSIVLVIFLILLSTALVFFIKFLRKADSVAGSVGSAATAFKRSAAAMPFIRLLSNLMARRSRRRE